LRASVALLPAVLTSPAVPEPAAPFSPAHAGWSNSYGRD